MAGSYRLTVRHGPHVERSRHDDVDAAIDALESRLERLSRHGGARRQAVDLRVRRFEPEAQVVARCELRGPQRWRPDVRAGVDLRGDGSLQAYAGGVQRAPLRPREGESGIDALRRAVRAVLDSGA